MDAVYCVESCPTNALILIDSEDLVSGRLKPLKKGSLVGLNFGSGRGLSKPEK
jgi:Fe-S-cluster-containing dehydrogenase component